MKTNIAELLRDCPTGMELDCASYDNVSFDKISDDKKATYPIFCYITDEKGNRSGISFTENGCESKRYGAKCVIFPKGKSTWEGFHRPFEDGDIVCYSDAIAIFKEWGDETLIRTHVAKYLNVDSIIDVAVPLFGKSIKREIRFATEEEKAKLFKAIKDNGYEWNAETKTLEKFPKFKAGDVIVNIYRKHLNGDSRSWKIYQIANDKYIFTDGSYIHIQDQNNWELVPNKFDITTLKPFESRVLIRNVGAWEPAFWGYYSKEYAHPFVVAGGNTFAQCIPYEGNQHLLGTTDDCDDFYKIWEE